MHAHHQPARAPKASSRNRQKENTRRGNVFVLAAALMVAMMGMVAFSVDTGYIYNTQTELQRSIDAAALAGAGALAEGQTVASLRVAEYLMRNPVGLNGTAIVEENLGEQINQFMEDHQGQLELTFGHWNDETGVFEASSDSPSAVQVSMEYVDMPLFFAPVLGTENFSVSASSVATYRPRDIVVVLDYSASMNDDSELKSMDALGQSAIEDNIEQIWEDLGSPLYGNMHFSPDWVTIPGVSLPVNVTWRASAVDVVATQPMQKVRLYFANGSQNTYTTSSGSGTWAGTGSNSGQRITKVKVKISGNWETFNFYSNSHIRRGLGLDSVTYPYPDASWNDYIEYARSHSSSMPWYDADVYYAGYRRKFGMLTLINFWNKNKPEYSQTPDLWMTCAQPVTAVKDAVDVFVDFIQEIDTDDQVALVVYNSSTGNGTLEFPLTENVSNLSTIARQKQAGHYHRYTNIGAGMEAARTELTTNGRPGALKMMVLMTDGNSNWINGGYNEAGANQYVYDEAAAAAAAKIPIVTISLGASADTTIMADVAQTTNGTHFNVPGGQAVSDYAEQLKDVFEELANDRPLKLVQ